MVTDGMLTDAELMVWGKRLLASQLEEKTMKQTHVTFTTCPRCTQPLAAFTVGDSRAVTWLLVRCRWVDLDSEPLTWCPTCAAPLPVTLPTAGESAEWQEPLMGAPDVEVR